MVFVNVGLIDDWNPSNLGFKNPCSKIPNEDPVNILNVRMELGWLNFGLLLALLYELGSK